MNINLTFDQANYINFLYQYRRYWQGFYIKEPVKQLGLNTINRYIKDDPFSKLRKMLKSSSKANGRQFKAFLEIGFDQYPMAASKYRDKQWYRTHFQMYQA